MNLDDYGKSGFEDREPHDAYCRCKQCRDEAKNILDTVKRERRIKYPNRIVVDDEIDDALEGLNYYENS